MHELPLADVLRLTSQALEKGDTSRAGALLFPALDQYPQGAAFWFLAGNILSNEGRQRLALAAFQRALDLDYQPQVLINMAAVHRRLNDYEAGRAAIEKALIALPDHVDALINAGGLYVNEGNPTEGMHYLERAMELEALARPGTISRAAWNLSLLELESGNFERGFQLYRNGVRAERPTRMYTAPLGGHEAHAPEPVTYEEGMPRTGKSIIIWAEQGIGDELMFGTILEEARADFGTVTLECHPRLQWLHERAHKGLKCYPTRKLEIIRWPIEDNVVADYKMALGDLGGLYRKDRAAFRAAWARAAPFYSVEPAEIASYRSRLEVRAAGRPIIGLASRGGTFHTCREHRSLEPLELASLVKGVDALFVSLDYENMHPYAGWLETDAPGRFLYQPAITNSWDYQHHGALAAACDMVVTVCQSIAHLSAAMGLNVRVLTPKRCAWRYGLTGEEWYWYPSPNVRLYRQTDPDSWAGPIARVLEDIKGLRP